MIVRWFMPWSVGARQRNGYPIVLDTNCQSSLTLATKTFPVNEFTAAEKIGAENCEKSLGHEVSNLYLIPRAVTA